MQEHASKIGTSLQGNLGTEFTDRDYEYQTSFVDFRISPLNFSSDNFSRNERQKLSRQVC